MWIVETTAHGVNLAEVVPRRVHRCPQQPLPFVTRVPGGARGATPGLAANLWSPLAEHEFRSSVAVDIDGGRSDVRAHRVGDLVATPRAVVIVQV